jgi:L-lactate dehydrogenase (cytochrome)
MVPAISPGEDSLRDDILKRLEAAKYPVLVLLCDVPSFGFRPRDIEMVWQCLHE